MNTPTPDVDVVLQEEEVSIEGGSADVAVLSEGDRVVFNEDTVLMGGPYYGLL